MKTRDRINAALAPAFESLRREVTALVIKHVEEQVAAARAAARAHIEVACQPSTVRTPQTAAPSSGTKRSARSATSDGTRRRRSASRPDAVSSEACTSTDDASQSDKRKASGSATAVAAAATNATAAKPGERRAQRCSKCKQLGHNARRCDADEEVDGDEEEEVAATPTPSTSPPPITSNKVDRFATIEAAARARTAAAARARTAAANQRPAARMDARVRPPRGVAVDQRERRASQVSLTPSLPTPLSTFSV